MDNLVDLVKNMSIKEGLFAQNVDVEASNQIDGSGNSKSDRCSSGDIN